MFPDLPPDPPALVAEAPLKLSGELRRNNLVPGRSTPPTAHCVLRESARNGIDPMVLLAVLKTEDGRAGELALNTDGSIDLGPMSVNSVWVPTLARRYGVSEPEIKRKLATDGCVNVAAGAWILGQKISERGSVWDGVAHFHSANPRLQAPYLLRVAERFERLVRRFSGGLG